MINTELEQELRAWLRPVSPMTAFAKTLRNEGESASQASTQEQQAASDPYEGIDLDELPDNVRAAIQKSRGEFTTLQTQATEAAQKAQKAEHFARQQQSEKDRLAGIVKKHNLPEDGKQQQQGDNRQANLAAKFEKDGLKPEAALAYAKMFIENNDMVRKEILEELTPLAASLGNMQADTLLASARAANAPVFAIPEINKMVTDNLAALVSQGSVVTKETIEHLTQMAYGSIAMNTPEKLKPVAPQGIPIFGQNLTTGNLPNRSQQTQQGPIATQSETVAIIQNLQTHLRHGLPPKK